MLLRREKCFKVSEDLLTPMAAPGAGWEQWTEGGCRERLPGDFWVAGRAVRTDRA